MRAVPQRADLREPVALHEQRMQIIETTVPLISGLYEVLGIEF